MQYIYSLCSMFVFPTEQNVKLLFVAVCNWLLCIVNSFLLLIVCLCCMYTTMYLSIPLVKGTWVVSSFWSSGSNTLIKPLKSISKLKQSKEYSKDQNLNKSRDWKVDFKLEGLLLAWWTWGSSVRASPD